MAYVSLVSPSKRRRDRLANEKDVTRLDTSQLVYRTRREVQSRLTIHQISTECRYLRVDSTEMSNPSQKFDTIQTTVSHINKLVLS